MSSSSKKRPRGSPTGETPQQASKVSSTSRFRGNPSARTILFSTPVLAPRDSIIPYSADWSAQEKLALVEFLLFYGFSMWTNTKNDLFWRKCAEFVGMRAKSSVKRTGIYS